MIFALYYYGETCYRSLLGLWRNCCLCSKSSKQGGNPQDSVYNFVSQELKQNINNYASLSFHPPYNYVNLSNYSFDFYSRYTITPTLWQPGSIVFYPLGSQTYTAMCISYNKNSCMIITWCGMFSQAVIEISHCCSWLPVTLHSAVKAYF